MVLFNFGRFQRRHAPKTRLASRFLGWYGTLFEECTHIRPYVQDDALAALAACGASFGRAAMQPHLPAVWGALRG